MLSVIVPIYNTAQYLSKCISSIIKQTYEELEIILVDDGSTDDSGAICDEYARRDSRIKVFHRENQGLVASRKFGVHMTSADYIAFVDSDDWIEQDMYENMMRRIVDANADIVTSSIYIERETNCEKVNELIEEGIYNREEINQKILPYMMYQEKHQASAINGSVWSKVFKKNLLKEIIEDLPLGMTYGEDAAITYPYICKAERMVVLSENWYHYIIHEDSMAHKYTVALFEKMKIFYDYMKNIFERLSVWDKLEYGVKAYLFGFLKNVVEQIYNIDIQSGKPYIFPYDTVPVNSDIVIYGAGSVGKDYIKNIAATDFVRLVAWVDTNYQNIRFNSTIIVESPQVCLEKEFDYILIAIENETVANEIAKCLYEMGIAKNKIVYKKPKRLKQFV